MYQSKLSVNVDWKLFIAVYKILKNEYWPLSRNQDDIGYKPMPEFFSFAFKER